MIERSIPYLVPQGIPRVVPGGAAPRSFLAAATVFLFTLGVLALTTATSAVGPPGPTTVSCDWTTTSPNDCWVKGPFTASVTPPTEGGAVGYHACRSVDLGPSEWGGCGSPGSDIVPPGTAGTSVQVGGSHLPSDGSRRLYFFRAQDAAGQWGPYSTARFVRVDRHDPAVSASGDSDAWQVSASATLAASDATGGASANSGLAELRYSWNTPTNAGCTNGAATTSGTTLTAPEGDNTLYLCARDRTGRVEGWNGRYRVAAQPPSAPGPTTVSCAWTTTSPYDCWVTGPFVASVTPPTSGNVAGYHACRSVDLGPTDWGGCGSPGSNIVPPGAAGPSLLITGSHLPSDGFRRAYFFRAGNPAGQWGPFSALRFVRVDRHDPTVSGTGAAETWRATASATIAASDAVNGANANSGLVEVRYSWNVPTNAACTNGTVTAPGATLTVTEGDNTLYLCGRDRTGRVGTWSGPYRVDAAPPTYGTLDVSDDFWSVGDGSVYQITAKASDAGRGVREMKALINLRGSNAGHPRGNYSWRHQDLGYLWAGDQVACTGGGFASKRPDAFNPETATLVGCSTTLNGDERTVVFSVRPEASFGTFGPINDVTYWAMDFRGLEPSDWRHDDTNFASGSLPRAELEVREAGGPPLAQNGDVAWGALDQGDSNGVAAKTILVRNKSSAGARNLVLEHDPSNVRIVGSDAFSIVGMLDSPLAPGEEDDFQVHLDTNRAGEHEARLWIYHSDSPPRPNPLTIELSATVVGTQTEPVVDRVDGAPILKGQIKNIVVHGENFQDAQVYVATIPATDDTPPRTYPTLISADVSADGRRVTARVDATASGVDGFYNLAIDTPAGVTAAQFRVVGPEPVIDTWTPSQPIRSRVHVLHVSGENLSGANVVPMHAGVRLLDLDNAENQSLSGLLFIADNVPLGDLDIRIEGTGGITMLPLVIQPTVEQATQPTQNLASLATSSTSPMPQILLQDPIVTHAPAATGLSNGMAAFGVHQHDHEGDDEGQTSISHAKRLQVKNYGLCFTVRARARASFATVLLSLFEIDGDALTQQVLNALLPGQQLDFRSLTLVLAGFIEFDFRYRLCDDGLSDTSYCVSGGISIMVPGIGGLSRSFSRCNGSGGETETELQPGGRINSHNYVADNDCFDAIDLAPGSIIGERDGEIRMHCCEPTTISLQTNGTAFGSDFVSQGPILDFDPNCAIPGASVDLTIKDVSFLDDLSLLRDRVGSSNAINDPVWKDPDLDGVPEVANNAVAYVRNRPMRVRATLVAEEAPTEPVSVKVRATGGGITLQSQPTTIGAGETEVEVELTSTSALPDETRRFDSLEFDWSYNLDPGSPTSNAGTTRHPFYITLADPVAGPTINLTVSALKLGVGSGGATDESSALTKAWNSFEGPANVNTWEGRPLTYYPAGVEARLCQVNALAMLQSGDGYGQCGAFAYLFMDALAAVGIPSTRVTVFPSDGFGFMVKDWSPMNVSHPGAEYPWELELVIGDLTSLPNMVPEPDGLIYGDLRSEFGIAGQNSPTPGQKVFNVHFIVKVSVPGQTPYYDPSYGSSFSTAGEFQSLAIYGIWINDPSTPPNVKRVRSPKPLDIRFSF